VIAALALALVAQTCDARLAEARIAVGESMRERRVLEARVADLERRLAARTSTTAREVIVYCPAPASVPDAPKCVCQCDELGWVKVLSYVGAGALGAGLGRLACPGGAP
jgi:environmental stress-induced protein Ves